LVHRGSRAALFDRDNYFGNFCRILPISLPILHTNISPFYYVNSRASAMRQPSEKPKVIIVR
jgi:hypothetical protein